jgi:hypothetical protein
MTGGNLSRFWAVMLSLGVAGMGLVFLFAVMETSRGYPTPIVPMTVAVVAGAMFLALLRGPIGKTVARLLESHGEPDDQLAARLDLLEDRLAELGLDQQRVTEQEERLDFAERLLSQRESAGTLRKTEQ